MYYQVRHFKPASHATFAIRGSPRHATRVLHAPAGPPFAAVCLARRAQLVVLTRLNRTVFELALAALEALPASLGARLYFPGGDAFSAFGSRQQLLDMHKLWQGRPRSEFEGGCVASRFVASFAEAGGGGWAGYKKRLERQHSPASVASRAACDLIEKSGAALPAQLARIAAATCDVPQLAHVRFSTAHRWHVGLQPEAHTRGCRVAAPLARVGCRL